MKNVFVAKQEKATVSSQQQERALMPFDWWLFTVVIFLLGIGLVMVLSASGIVAEQSYGDKYYFFNRQLIFAGIAGLCLWVAALMPRAFLYRIHYVLLILAFFLMIITLFSTPINGARRWIRLGFFSVQSMEFVKIAMALYLAYFMSEKHELIKSFWRGVVPPTLVTGLFCLLLLLQPDFGSAVVLASILFFMCMAGGTRIFYLLLALSSAAGGAWLLAVSAPYRMRRLLAFIDPFKDAQDTGYQLVQSLLAIGSGGFSGVGVGASRQKMFYLPEAHNDFIMAVVGEETGFLGITFVMLLLAFFFWRCLRIVLGQQTLRDRYSAFGITLIIALGAALNLAVVMGAAPPKGVPMPFLSYGGSNLVATMICVGLLMNFSRTVKPCSG
jgi:cell division protein FtsW